MAGLEDREIEEKLQALKREADKNRRRAERIGGAVIAATSALVAVVFLWVLALSLRRPADLALTLTVVAGAVAMFAWGLKIAVFGR